jgi:predicted ribosomally synthesized peptide with nif11-like leader
MSLEQADKFVEKLLERDTLRCQMAQCSSIQERLSVAHANGYDVDIDDFKKLSEIFLVSHGVEGFVGFDNNNVRGKFCHTYDIPGGESVLIAKRTTEACHVFTRAPKGL